MIKPSNKPKPISLFSCNLPVIVRHGLTNETILYSKLIGFLLNYESIKVIPPFDIGNAPMCGDCLSIDLPVAKKSEEVPELWDRVLIRCRVLNTEEQVIIKTYMKDCYPLQSSELPDHLKHIPLNYLTNIEGSVFEMAACAYTKTDPVLVEPEEHSFKSTHIINTDSYKWEPVSMVDLVNILIQVGALPAEENDWC